MLMLRLFPLKTVPISTALLLASFFTAFKLFTAFKTYNMHLQNDPVASPRASFVSSRFDREPVERPSIFRRVLGWVGHSWSISWRFFFNMKPPVGRLGNFANSERVQQLNVWNPGAFELHLFAIYSPVHALLWMATSFSNWILMFIIMGIVGTQACTHCDPVYRNTIDNTFADLPFDEQLSRFGQG